MRNMRQRGSMAVAIALTAGLGLAVSGVAAQEEMQEEQPQEEELCRATLAPTSIVQQEEPLEIQVAFAEEIGTTTEVEPQENSGLEVIKVEKAVEIEKRAEAETEEEQAEEYEAAANVPAYDVLLRVNATAAESGEWELHFQGTDGECVGTIQVTPPVEVETPPQDEGSGEPPRL